MSRKYEEIILWLFTLLINKNVKSLERLQNVSFRKSLNFEVLCSQNITKLKKCSDIALEPQYTNNNNELLHDMSAEDQDDLLLKHYYRASAL